MKTQHTEWTGIKRTIESDQFGKVHNIGTMDDSQIVEACKQASLWNPDGYIDEGKNMKKVASIPMIVVEQIYRKHGINIMNATPEEQVRFFGIIDREYPHLRTSKSELGRA